MVSTTFSRALAAVLLAVAGTFWFLRGRGHEVSADGTLVYKDSLYEFSVEYPLDWSKTSDSSDLIGFGFGKESDAEWVRLNIYTDKDTQHAFTGLTDGFIQYQDTLKKQINGFELNGSKLMQLNDATVMFFGFTTPTLQGKGIYMLNGDGRVVVECFSPRAIYQQYAPAFSSILQSFRRGSLEPQQFIDFPIPNEGMQQFALANPDGLSHQVDEHIQSGEALLAGKDVKPDNLYESMQAYRAALQLAIAPPQRLPSYQDAAEGLSEATKLFNQALERQRFEINRALKEGNKDDAYWAAHKMMQMMPDKTDPAYQEAYKIVQSLQPPK